MLQVREGFIVDEEDEEPEERARRRKRDRKRRRAEREEEEAVLDEEDLDLIGEANPDWERKAVHEVCRLFHLFILIEPI
jgi:transcription elongation factor SPT6